MKTLAILLLMVPLCAMAEPGNAPDTKGHFVLVVGGSKAYSATAWTGAHMERIEPFTIPGFQSFKLCVGAGKELQARLNTDGYTLDFACIATGR